jgi:hypothetical protein
MFRRSSRSWSLLLLVTGLLLAACSVVVSPSKPSVVIDTPPSGSQFHDGDTVSVQSTSTDPAGIARVDLLVDGNVVRSDTPPAVQASFSVIQTWKATAGSHTIAVRAFNAANVESGPAAVAVAVVPGAVAGAPTAAITPTVSPAPTTAPTAVPSQAPTAAPAACVNNSAFVVDVTVPDGTLFEPGQPFNKIWRVRNSGTCTWASGYTFVFTGGTPMQTVRSIGVPPTTPGATADLLIPMTAPTVPGSFTSFWRLRSPSGTLFGTTLTAVIRVPAPQPAPTVTPSPVPTSACTGTPIITSFTASPTTITPGQTATLSFGLVANADRAEIDNGIGGVATPGNVTVQPGVTTTYTLTARCSSTTTISQVTIVVTSAFVRCAIFGESGEAVKAGNTLSASQALRVGVDGSNHSHRAFFSFDLSGLAGKTIDSANLNVAAPSTQGNPFSLGALIVESVDYAPPVVGTDYGLASTPVLSISTGPAGQFGIAGAVQNAASSSRTRLQLRFRFGTETSSTTNLLTWPSNNQVCINLAFH